MSQGGESARSDLRGGAGWMLLGLAILVGAWRMDRFENQGASLYTAPGLVPGLLGLLLMLLGAWLAWRGWRAGRAAAVDTGVPLLNRRIVLMFLLCLGYALVLVGRAPFAASTALFVSAFTWFYANPDRPARRVAVALASGVLTALVIVLVFERIFLVRLP